MDTGMTTAEIMWQDCKNDDYTDLGQQNVKSLLMRRRKWRLMLQMIKSGDFPQMIGIFLNINKKGYITRSIKLIISNVSGPHENVSVESRPQVHGFMQYIWSSQGRCITLKQKGTGTSMKRKKRKQREIHIKNTDNNECNTANSTDVVPVSSNKQENEDSQWENESEEEDASDNEDEETVWTHPPKKASRNLKYLYSDVYTEKRHSKKRSFHMKNYLEDIVLIPNNKLKYCQQKEPNDVATAKFVDDSDDGYIARSTVPVLTLWEFMKAEVTDSLDPKKSSLLDGIEIDENFTQQKKSTQTNTANEVETNTLRNENEKTKEKSLINLQRAKTESEHDSEKSVPDTFQKDLDDGTNSRTLDHNDKSTDEKEYMNFPSVILLSRNLTRPDILRKDFKLNYKEAQCKPRRFLINISHLAYQHLILKGIAPLQVIPKLDLSLYLVFSFMREAADNADEYRIVINDTLHLRNLKITLAPLCQGKVISIHEVMQYTIAALDSLDVNQIKYKDSSDLDESIDNKATHSFNLLTAVLKWNTKILDHPHALEWAGDSSNTGFMTLESNSNEKLLAQVKGNDGVLLEQTIDNRISKGPHRPSICGICLRDFCDDRLSFPMALCVCSHWFCETCWKATFNLSLNKQDQNCLLVCLEDGCTSPMDSASLLSLLPLQVVRNYELHKMKIVIENSANTRLCSNPMCNKIVCAKNQTLNGINQVINVTCSCFYQMCFSCSSPPHWPLKCVEAKLYQRRLHVSQHDKFKHILEDDELPEIVLRGQSCPSCGEVNRANFQFSGVKTCSCGNVFCWMCGKDLSGSQEVHLSCTQKFQNEDKKLKEKLNTQDQYWIKNGEAIRWYKVALHHRQLQHPQVVAILYKMADSVAEAVGETARKGKQVGNIRQATFGWKNAFRKFAETKLKFLQQGQCLHPTPDISSRDKISTLDSVHDRFEDNFHDSPRSISSLSSTESLQTESQEYGESLNGSPVPCPPYSSKSRCDPLLRKAVLNIVNTKLELHHIIEHVAAFLEYSHTLKEREKVIHSLERVEDMCTCLDMLLQPTHPEACTRILPSFLRLRLQIMNILTTLQINLRQH